MGHAGETRDSDQWIIHFEARSSGLFSYRPSLAERTVGTPLLMMLQVLLIIPVTDHHRHSGAPRGRASFTMWSQVPLLLKSSTPNSSMITAPNQRVPNS